MLDVDGRWDDRYVPVQPRELQSSVIRAEQPMPSGQPLRGQVGADEVVHVGLGAPRRDADDQELRIQSLGQLLFDGSNIAADHGAELLALRIQEGEQHDSPLLRGQ